MKRRLEFDDLPVEMKDAVLTNLDHESKKVARLVSKEWENIVEDKVVFEATLSDDTYESFKKFDKDRPIAKLVVQNFEEPLPSTSSSRSGLNKNIRFLRVGGIGPDREFGDNPHNPYCLTKFFENDSSSDTKKIAPANLKTLFELNTGIQGLSVSGTAFTDFKQTTILKRIQWNNLTILDINFSRHPTLGLQNQSMQPYVQLLRNVYPSLQTLLYSSPPKKTEIRLFVAVMECVAAHKDTLRRLKIVNRSEYLLTNSAEPRYPQEKYNALMKNIRETRLEYLLIDLLKCGPNNGDRWRQLEKTFLESQTKLKDLRLIARDTMDLDFQLIFNSISSTVTDVTLWLHCIGQQAFDCSVVQKCTRLRGLALCLEEKTEFIQPLMLQVNVQLLTKTLGFLWCGHMVSDMDCRWLAENMTNLEVLVYGRLLHRSDKMKTRDHFLVYLDLPRLKKFRIDSFRCPMIIRFAEITSGLMVNHNVKGTDIRIDQDNFTHGGYFVGMQD